MTKIKICGITNDEDAELAVGLGADALGFNFYPQSPRYISAENAAAIIGKLSSRTWKVGIFVNHSQADVLSLAKASGIDTLQFHGEESVEFCSLWQGFRTIKAIGVAAQSDIEKFRFYQSAVDHLLVDHHTPAVFGGTGKQVEFHVLKAMKNQGLLAHAFLAGGLKPENVRCKIEEFSPWGVDVASGVELCPGKKDPRLLEAFFDAVRAARQ